MPAVAVAATPVSVEPFVSVAERRDLLRDCGFYVDRFHNDTLGLIPHDFEVAPYNTIDKGTRLKQLRETMTVVVVKMTRLMGELWTVLRWKADLRQWKDKAEAGVWERPFEIKPRSYASLRGLGKVSRAPKTNPTIAFDRYRTALGTMYSLALTCAEHEWGLHGERENTTGLTVASPINATAVAPSECCGFPGRPVARIPLDRHTTFAYVQPSRALLTPGINELVTAQQAQRVAPSNRVEAYIASASTFHPNH
ncbi:uncharacterized protein EV422DRAFT_510476 [Fimicolochytrium jonesii]|uniref:uncharacterized protein n=1 Tax=Fimicolochytrium jonesii TaxID=1396493 RepID=UPI0022FE243A|nr:uncharacterized protein EV422DRAFT_510476 [Fimicolochytrium jonesii]KAI8815583.1 hypothetical protein EV422DRAFT_510476 [Fimicolochytrium jonesii]